MGGQIGKYDLLERLAVGGMAELFLARSQTQHGFKKTVVLKRILPSFAEQPDFVQMFLTEAKLAAGLHHPNIAQVFDFGEEDGSYYFTMEFVAGRNVRQVLLAGHHQGEPLPMGCALRIIDCVAAGLHHAHEQRDVDGNLLRIVHRDVSPSNVLVNYDGNIKLVDFGIAKIAARGPATVAGSLKGKVSYMSPEQCRGELVDRRSDIFSLGTLLWELTTRRKLFGLESQGLQLLKQVERADIPLPSSVVDDYPPELEAIVLKAMSRSRQDRYATAQEFRIALEDFTLRKQISVSSTRLSAHMETLFPERNSKSVSLVSSLPRVPEFTGDEESGAAPLPELPTASDLVPAVEEPAAISGESILAQPEKSELKTLVAELPSEREQTEVSGGTPIREDVSHEPPRRSFGVLWGAAAALLLATGGVVWWQATSSDEPNDSGTAPAVAKQDEPPPPKARTSEASDAAAPPAAETPPANRLPALLSDLRQLSYADRHALLATTTDKVHVELHVGLDLVQAEQSDDPCRTFSDALDIVEDGERPRAYLWALQEAEVPAGKSRVCRKLGPRVAALLARVAPPEPEPTHRKPRNKRPDKTRTRHSTPVEATPVPTTPAPVEPEPKKPKDGVATKLDDDLRGL